MNNRWLGRRSLLAASLLTLTLTSIDTSASAAQKKIRVALFIDSGQGYRNTLPAYTLTSETGFSLALSGKSETALPDIDEETMRVRVDEFQLVVKETSSLNEAQKVAQQLGQRKLDAQIQLVKKGNKKAYRVLSGSYDTYQLALAQAKTAAQATGTNPQIRGPYHLEVDEFKSLKEAEKWEEEFEEAGIQAYTVLVGGNKKPDYAVWIGAEISENSLDNLEATAAKKFPRFSYKEPTSEEYVLLNEEVIDGSGETAIGYTIAPKVKLTVSPQKGKDEQIGVVEREQRRYRGDMELSEYKGKLALINELPVEEYLYGVVGAEMQTGWPLEALKVQAVLARTRALSQTDKYEIADVSDTVLEQVYMGIAKEAPDVRKAVDKTEGEVLQYRGKMVEALFYSNAGGMTADGTEVWGNEVPYLRPVESDDAYPTAAANQWYMVSLQDGTIGYVRTDFVTMNGETNELGLSIGQVNTDNLNFRSGPSTTYHKVIQSLPVGTEVTVIRQEPEENAYAWTRGPYTASEITAMINASQKTNKGTTFSSPIQSLEVTKRGPSGRVVEMEADGKELKVSSPDAFRSVFKQGESSLRSTKFEVEQMGTITAIGANGKKKTVSGNAHDWYAMGAGKKLSLPNSYADSFLILDGGGNWRVATKDQMFLLRGHGFGHGLGVSQYGAKAMAEQGYDYKEILQHYYRGIKIDD